MAEAMNATMTSEPASDPTSVSLTFDDFYIVSAEGVDAFAVDWNEHPTPAPYHVTVDGRRFAYTGTSFLVRGHGASMPEWVTAEEVEGRLVLFVERDERLLAYVHDPNAVEEE
jgi:hypothetical protein